MGEHIKSPLAIAIRSRKKQTQSQTSVQRVTEDIPAGSLSQQGTQENFVIQETISSTLLQQFR